MANYSVWNVRLRHEWLATPLKKRRIKRRSASRIGLLDAWERKQPKTKPAEEDESASATETAE